MERPLISLENVTMRYGNVTAVTNVSMQIPRGRIVGLLGPNGAGKSTTMKILTGFMSPTEGRVEIDGHDMFEDPMAAKALLGYMPETPPLYGSMIVRDYLAFAASLRGVPSSTISESVNRAISSTGLTSVAHRIIENLSKGYRQRVGIAQALVHEPPILVLDEPTAGLDPVQIIEVRQLIAALAGDRTVVISTHILPEVTTVCNHVIIIHQGRVVADGPLDDLSRTVATKAKIGLTVRAPAPEVRSELSRLKDVEAVEIESAEEGTTRLWVYPQGNDDPRAEISMALAGRGWPILELRPPGLTLEEVFVRLTMRDDIETEVTHGHQGVDHLSA